MKKILLSFVMLLSTLSIMAGVEAKPISVEDALENGSVVTLCVGEEYLYGSGAQNCAKGTPAEVVAEKNAVIGFKLEKIEEGILFRAVTPQGGDYSLWGDNPCYLNSQPGGGVTFILGLAGQNGKDAANCAVWTFEADGSLKNVGNDKYFNLTGMSDAPVTVSLVEMVGEPDPEPEPDPVVFPESLNSLVEDATVFTLKIGDQYLYGTDQQGIGIGDWDTACAEANNANGYILEKNEDGYAFFRAVKADGANISAWGTTPCYLNAQPAVGGVIFNMGKDQDFKNGSTWIIEEVEGGYTIQNLGNNGYLSGNGLSETPATWELYVPEVEDPIEISPAFVFGEDEVVLNTKGAVSVEMASAIVVDFINGSGVQTATYVINEMDEQVGEESSTWVPGEEVAKGELSINSKGYAEFEAPISFEQGKKFQLTVVAMNGETELAKEVFEFNGAYVPELVVTPEFVAGEESVSVVTDATVASAEGLSVNFENVMVGSATYVINSLKAVAGEESTEWVADEEIAKGDLSINTIGYAEFDPALTFYVGTKYELVIKSFTMGEEPEEIATNTFEFNGGTKGQLIADGTYYIKNIEAGKFLSNGANWGTRSVLADNGIAYNVKCANGKYTLYSGIKGETKALRPSDGFNDQSGEWIIEEDEDGESFYLFNGEKYFYFDGSDVPQFAEEKSEAAKWAFVTADELKAALSAATLAKPVDATVFIKGADFLNSDEANKAWSANKVGGDNGSGNTLVNNTNCEQWNAGTFDINQEITGLPNGFYSLSVYGFYRHGNREGAANPYENKEETPAILYAGEKSVELKSIYSEAKEAQEGGWATESVSDAGTKYFIANSQANAAACFSEGAYLNTIENIEVTDGTLKIGVKREGEAIFDWTVFDNFRLSYYGDGAIELGEPSYSVEEGAEIDLAEVSAITINFPDAVNLDEDADIYVEGEILCKDQSEPVPFMASGDLEDGADIMINGLEAGKSYNIVITKVGAGEVIGMDEETYAPIFEYEEIAEEGESLYTFNFMTAEAAPEPLEAEVAVNGTELKITFAEGTDLGDNNNPELKITVVNAAGEVVATETEHVTDNTTGEFFDPLNLVIVTLDKELAAGEYSVVIPAGFYIVNGGSNNDELTFDFKVEEPEPELAETALTKNMFCTWDSYEANGNITAKGVGAYDLGVSTGLPYGDGNVLGQNYADLTGCSMLALTVTEGTPRLLFNRQSLDGSSSDFLEVKEATSEYVVKVEEGVWYINIAKITEDKGYAHLNCIKGANWANTTITEMTLLGTQEAIDAVGIKNVQTTVKANGKYMENGKVVIVRNGVKYNTNGVIVK